MPRQQRLNINVSIRLEMQQTKYEVAQQFNNIQYHYGNFNLMCYCRFSSLPEGKKSDSALRCGMKGWVGPCPTYHSVFISNKFRQSPISIQSNIFTAELRRLEKYDSDQVSGVIHAGNEMDTQLTRHVHVPCGQSLQPLFHLLVQV